MGNRNKKFWSMLLSFVLIATTIFGTSMIPQATKTYAATDLEDTSLLDGTITVHFRRPNNWSQVPRIYAYVENGKDKTIHLSGKGWSTREEMTQETKVGENTWYSYEVPKYTGPGTTYVIFTDGMQGNEGDDKHRYPKTDCEASERLALTKETWYYYHSDGTMDIHTTNPISSATPSVTPTNTATPSATPAGEMIRIHFRRPSEWKNVPKIYAYLKPQKSTKENEENKTNPTSVHFSGATWNERQEMKLEGTNEKGTWYYFDIPKYNTGYSYAIFTNGESDSEKNRYPADKDYDHYLIVTGETWYHLDSGLNMTVSTKNETSDISVPTPTATATTKPSATPIVTATTKPSATPTATPIATATVDPSATPVATATVEQSATPIATATVEPSVTPIATETTDPTEQPTDVPQPTEATSTVAPTQAAPTAEAPQTTVPVQTVAPTQVAATSTPNVTVTVPTGSAASDNTTITPSAVTAKVTFSKAGKTVGESVLIKVALSGKKSAAAYTFSYYIDGRAVKSNTSSSTYEWTLTSKGVHKVTVIVKENNKMVTHKEVTYKVNPRVITIQKFTPNKKSGQKAKSKITLSVVAKTTTGKLSYRFAVQKGKGKVAYLGKYSKKKKVVWKPTSKGTYKLYVYVKNGKGVEVKKVIKSFKIK